MFRSIKKLSLYQIILSGLLFGCSDSAYLMTEMDTGFYTGAVSQTLRIDITPSDATQRLLPQSFLIDSSIDWQELSLELMPSTTISGNVHGYSIFPYLDIALPGEDVAVEAQIKIEQKDNINGALVNSDQDGYFALSLPQGSDYQLSVSPLSPQNVPYTIVNNLSFAEDTPLLDIDLGVGTPIYGLVQGLDDTVSITAQLIDGTTKIKGPKIDVADNGYFQLRAPLNRNDFIIRFQGAENNIFPTLDIPVYMEENNEYGVRQDISIGDIQTANVSGRILFQNAPYIDRATIRFRSISLDNTEGSIEIETNNDVNGRFSANLLKGSYDVEIIPPYSENSPEAPISFQITVDENTETLEDISLKEKIQLSAIVIGADDLPSTNVTVNVKEQGFSNAAYSTKTDDNGRLEILVPPTDLNISLIPDNSIEAITNLSFNAAGNISEQTWNLENGVTLSGSLMFEEEMVSFALIEVFQGDILLANGLSDASGNFHLQVHVND